MCVEARGCRRDDVRRVIFAEYVRLIGRSRCTPTVASRDASVPENLSEVLKGRSSDFSRASKKRTGSVLANAPLMRFAHSVQFIIYAYAKRQILTRRYKQVAVNEKIRVRLKSYDHTLIDAAAEKIVEVAKRNGAAVSGPIPLPTEKEIVTILRAVHKYKDSREQFEMRTHKRLIDIIKPSQKVVDALMSVELPAGVEIEVKI